MGDAREELDDIREELAQLRRDIDELKAGSAAGELSGYFGEGTSGQVNEALVRHLKATMEKEGKIRGIAICRLVVSCNEGGSMCRSGIITMSSTADLPKGDRLRQSVTALATDPLALRAVRKLIEPYFAGKPTQMMKAELAATLGTGEDELETSLRPLVADRMLRWSKTATGEETYEIEDQEPHVLLLQSLE
jgi:hypothetical protein